MPNPTKGARLYLRKRRGRSATWVILDRGREVATGSDESDRCEAEKALANYIARKYDAPDGPCHPDQMSLGRALEIYGEEKAGQLAAPELVGFHIDALDPFWGDLPVSAVKGETCRRYVKSRDVKPTTARRELETLGAALNYCHREGYLTHAPRVTLPPKPKGRTRWLTRKEAAKLLWAARHSPHLRTFILIGLYTGTRSAAIFGLQWHPNTQGGWVDLEAGLLFRGAEGRIETNKRVPACSLPRKLIAHLRRARKRTTRYVIEYEGKQVQKLRRSWGTARTEAGLGPDVTPHVLRHTSVTWRLLKGVPLRDVAEYVGMSEKMCRDTYGHHCPDYLEKARDAI